MVAGAGSGEQAAPGTGWPGRVSAPSAGPALEVDALSVRYGGISAISELSFSVGQGSIYGVIGPNGAGKTTLFNCLSRLTTPTTGDIRLHGMSILPFAAKSIAGLGIGRTFQNVALFRELSVLDNVLIGCHSRTRAGFLAAAFRSAGAAREERRSVEHARALLRDFDLEPHAGHLCAELPFGIQKRVEMARAMATDPRILLLDEPAAGLNHEELEALMGMIRKIQSAGQTTILLVEHNVAMVMALCDRVLTIDFGRKIAEGTPEQVRQDPVVVAAYLGGVPA